CRSALESGFNLQIKSTVKIPLVHSVPHPFFLRKKLSVGGTGGYADRKRAARQLGSPLLRWYISPF
ncbi:hypothetical protein, partial [Rikenella microfusus]|uniref:hypothetical protein n=1 Tax=Rikenella microfusus TaxID=28139 RepID=UPI00267070B3